MAPVVKKGKGKKSAEPVNPGQAVLDRLRQLEQSQAGDKEQELEIEREVKRLSRDMASTLSSLPTPMSRIDHLLKKNAELNAQCKRLQIELKKTKEREAQSVKDKDSASAEVKRLTERGKMLESTTRSIDKDNKKLKVEDDGVLTWKLRH